MITPSRAMGFTPFFMVYKYEVVLPNDLEYGAPRVKTCAEQDNKTFLEDAIDQI